MWRWGTSPTPTQPRWYPSNGGSSEEDRYLLTSTPHSYESKIIKQSFPVLITKHHFVENCHKITQHVNITSHAIREWPPQHQPLHHNHKLIREGYSLQANRIKINLAENRRRSKLLPRIYHPRLSRLPLLRLPSSRYHLLQQQLVSSSRTNHIKWHCPAIRRHGTRQYKPHAPDDFFGLWDCVGGRN